MGGAPSFSSSMAEFIDTIHDACFIDAGYSGSIFTWCNNRSGRGRQWARLDRMLVNASWLRLFPKFGVDHITRAYSDHSPITMTFNDELANFPRPFQFQRMLTTHQVFIRVVREAWEIEMVAAPMFKVFIKMKLLKRKLKDWNRAIFGDVHSNVQKAEDELARAENSLLSSNSETDLVRLKSAQESLKLAQLQEELFWKQKSRISWLHEGDRNTKFFYDSVRVKCRKLVIDRIKTPSGEILDNRVNIGREAEAYFKDLFSAQSRTDNEALLSSIPAIVTEHMNTDLMTPLIIDEVKAAALSIPIDSAPGPDDFGGTFFSSCWDIIGSVIYEAAKDFFSGVPLPRAFQCTHICLIPKKPNSETIADFRPISLSNGIMKNFSKITATRLASILSSIISEEQGAFVKGRYIAKKISIVREVANDLDRKVFGGNMILKLDMENAYDRVDWEFLAQALWFLPFIQRFKTRGPTLPLLMTILFLNARLTTVCSMLKFIGEYEDLSNQKVNASKSAFILSRKALPPKAHRIVRMTGYMQAYLPCTYLGIPLTKGKIQAPLMMPLIHKILSKMEGWKVKILNPADRLTLIKHVLSSIPIHVLSTVNIPKATCRMLESGLVNFFRGLRREKRRSTG
ncbi:uncharacterized protein LOC131219091 [Magnolia sinica]|uniref:uncharacterized protein LOC131219091 n=1 Tax=Magnolia sinica TaxID=86752 RepID=UPI002658AB03|nr:uncharacterized protein LOC131219091 [Magnolia sinica]